MATPVEVVVHVYDLSAGMAAALSQSLIGKQIDGVWHTGVVVFGREYFFGGGIQAGLPGSTQFGRPTKKLSGFTTEVTQVRVRARRERCPPGGRTEMPRRRSA